MAYAGPADLRLGNVPLPADPMPQRAVDQAAEEINAALGFTYQTPIVVPDGTPTKTAIESLLKQINVFLASGRLILELSAGTENHELHAYAKYLIEQATTVLCKIKDGEIVLDGVLPANPGNVVQSGPLLINQDDAGMVDRFYGELSNPIGRVHGDTLPPMITYPNSSFWPYRSYQG